MPELIYNPTSKGSGRGRQGQTELLKVQVEPQSFYKAAPSSKQEESNLFTHTSPSQSYSGPVDTDTNSEQHGSYRQVGQGHLHTMSDNGLYLNPTQVDPEPTNPVVGFRPHQSLTQLATQLAHQKGDSSWHQNLLDITLPQGAASAQCPTHGD